MTKPTRILAVLSLLATLFSHPATAKVSPEQAEKLATTPDDRLELRWWRDRHDARLDQRKKALAEGRQFDLVFVGDSITQGWEGAGKQLWKERYAPRNAFNLGFSGDRTEHVLWRMGLGDERGPENNEFAGLTPKLFVVMIGTNNTGHREDPPAATAAGITAIIDELQKQSPDSKILLLGVFPRGMQPDDTKRKINVGINEQIAPLGQRDGVEFLDISEVFLNDEGILTKQIMPDALHPRAKGYKLWADAIEEPVARLLGE